MRLETETPISLIGVCSSHTVFNSLRAILLIESLDQIKSLIVFDLVLVLNSWS